MLDAQMKRGLIENCVLAATARGDSYGYKIVKDLSGCVNVTESTLYPILRRLESAGCLTVGIQLCSSSSPPLINSYIASSSPQLSAKSRSCFLPSSVI